MSHQQPPRTRALNSFKSYLIVVSTVLLLAAMIQTAQADAANQLSLRQPGLNQGAQSAEFYLQRGDDLLEKQNFRKAVLHYNQALRMDRTLDEAFLGRGLALGGIGKAYEAIADLNVYILRNPRHSMAHVYRGARYMWFGDPKSAERDLLKAIQLSRQNAQAYDDLGVLYAQQGDLQRAVKFFRKTISLDKHNELAYYNLAIAYYLLDNNDAALQMINKAVLMMPESREAYLLKAEVQEAMGLEIEAQQTRSYAEFLQQAHWSESISLQ